MDICVAQEKHRMRRVRDSIPYRVWIVAILVFWERAAFWGLTAPWQNYMEHQPRHDAGDVPGALGLGQSMATRAYCLFYVFYYTTPVPIAILADTRLGRHATLVISIFLYCLGCAVLTVSSTPSSLIKGWGVPGLVVAMILIGLGGGGFRAITVPFIADQYTDRVPRLLTQKTGERVVTDQELTLQYICSLYYWVGNLGSLSWFLTVQVEMHYGFAQAYGITLGFLVIVLLMLLIGRRWYIHVPNERNILPDVARIVVCACREGFKMERTDPAYQFLRHRRSVSWSAELAKQVVCTLRACRVLLAFVMFYICFDQMQNNLVSQAAQMKTDGTPNDLLPAMNQVGCIILGPIIQHVLYPFLHRRHIYPTAVVRITIGFVFITLSMLYATILQRVIYNASPCYDQEGGCEFQKVGVWIQAPLYLLISTGEIFAYTTALEYAYNCAPKEAKSTVQAISLLIGAVGSLAAMALTPLAQDPRMVVFYALLTAAMGATTITFWLLFRTYDRQRDTIDDGSETHQGVDRVAESAPYLDPIEVDYTIELFGRYSSNEVFLEGASAERSRVNRVPTLPRRSSWRTPRVVRRPAEPLGRY